MPAKILAPVAATAVTIAIAVLHAAPTPAASDPALGDPRSVMVKSRELRRGLTNTVADVTMTIRSGSDSAVRRMRHHVLEVVGDGNRTINVFSEPADIRGVSVLTHSALRGDDRQWLFLPSIGRVKRISSSNRSGAFAGSQFAYEDLSSFEVEKYEYVSVESGTVEGKSVLIVEYIPNYPKSGYSRLRAHIDPDTGQPVEIHYLNRRGEHFKTLHLSDYHAYEDGGAWRAHRLVMTNHTDGKSTEIVFSAFTKRTASASSFNSNRFQSVR